MKKEEKLKHIDVLIFQVISWVHYSESMVKNFINEAQFKIVKIHNPNSIYIKEIDIFTNGKSKDVIIDWNEQILNVLNKLRFEIEIAEDNINSTNKILTLHCNKCNHSTNQKVLFENYEKEITQENVKNLIIDFWTHHYFQILKCGSCNEYAFRKYDIWCDDAPDFPELNISVLPKRGSSTIKPIETFHNVPQHIISLYKEVIEAFVNEVNILCAGGIRAVLEAICIDKYVKKGTIPEEGTKESLKGKIYGLHEKGFITLSHVGILIHHQYLGDKALHQLERPSKEELEIAIDIIGDTLISIYDLEFKGQELKNRKENRTAK